MQNKLPSDDKFLLDSLQRHYDLVNDRRKTLSGQASSLMTFAGVIQSIFVAGLLLPLVTSSDAKKALYGNLYSPILILTVELGFSLYVVTAITAVLAYKETKWTPAPVIVQGNSEKEWSKWLANFQASKAEIPHDLIELQLVTAIHRHQLTNDGKYAILLVGYLFLIAGLVVTALVGFLVLLGSPH